MGVDVSWLIVFDLVNTGVPEPAGLVRLGSGLAALVGVRVYWRRRSPPGCAANG